MQVQVQAEQRQRPVFRQTWSSQVVKGVVAQVEAGSLRGMGSVAVSRRHLYEYSTGRLIIRHKMGADSGGLVHAHGQPMRTNDSYLLPCRRHEGVDPRSVRPNEPFTCLISHWFTRLSRAAGVVE